MQRFLVHAAALLLGSTLSLSTAQADDCQDVTGSQADLNSCYGNQLKTSDGELNKLYKELERRADDAELKQSLVKSQRAWIAYRDAECDMQTIGGGSIVGMSRAICLSGLTMQRIDDFKRYLKCEEGDSNCPFPSAGN